MKKSSLWMYISSIFIISLLSTSCCEMTNTCDDPLPDVQISGQGEFTYFWLTASQDAYVTSEMPEFTGNTYSLVAGHGQPNGERRAYIKFFIPQLPAETEVLEAYINVYEDSRQVPGYDGIVVEKALTDWSAKTITWNNQPTPPGYGATAGIAFGRFIEHNMWRTTQDIHVTAQTLVDDPASHYGFILSNQSQNTFTRSFTSMNAPTGRSVNSLGFCPRLLLKVRSIDQLNMENIDKQIYGNHEFLDLYGAGNQFTIFMMARGDEWPRDWNVPTN